MPGGVAGAPPLMEAPYADWRTYRCRNPSMIGLPCCMVTSKRPLTTVTEAAFTQASERGRRLLARGPFGRGCQVRSRPHPG
jgi:hypothetical protein